MGANRNVKENVKELLYENFFTVKSKLLELSELLIWKPFIVLKIVRNRFDRIKRL